MLIIPKKYLFNVESGFIQWFWFVDDPIDLRFIQFVFDVVQHNSQIEFEFYGCSQCKSFSLKCFDVFFHFVCEKKEQYYSRKNINL